MIAELHFGQPHQLATPDTTWSDLLLCVRVLPGVAFVYISPGGRLLYSDAFAGPLLARTSRGIYSLCPTPTEILSLSWILQQPGF
jgi:hypothetical protein